VVFSLWRIVFAEICLFSVCVLGDILSQNQNGLPIMRALFDSATHGLVGIIAWFIAIDNGSLSVQSSKEIILCGVLAAIVDLDHFIAARSLSLDVRGSCIDTAL